MCRNGPLRLLLAVLLCACAPLTSAQELSAWLDRSEILEGETVTLNIELIGTAGGQSPDLSVLDTDFEVLGSSASSQISLINGRQSARTTWAVALEPRRTGEMQVPPVTLGGQQTRPVSLRVRPAPPLATPGSAPELFLELEASPEGPYVQQQVRLVLRLYYAMTLTEGGLEAPTVEGARLEPLGADLNYSAERHGRRYTVVERRYAMIPERSGALTVQPARFQGRALSSGGGMFDRGRRVQANSSGVELQVRPRPADAPPGPWLPAPALSLREGLVLPPEVRVGEPVTRQVVLAAQGLGEAQLPEVSHPEPSGARVYPDQSVSRSRSDGVWLSAEREQRFAIVASEPGDLELPELVVHYWNTESDRAETARLPAHRLRVLPAIGAATPVPGDGAPATAVAEGGAAPPWSIALLSALIGFACGIALMASRARRLLPPASAPATNPREVAAADLAPALARENPRQLAAALLAGSGSERSGLTALAVRVQLPEQAELLRRLDRHLYAGADLEDFWPRARQYLARGPQLALQPASVVQALPPLYSSAS